MKPNVTSFFDTATNTISYVVADPNGNSCAIIDSVLDFDFSSGRTNTAFVDNHGIPVEDAEDSFKFGHGLLDTFILSLK